MTIAKTTLPGLQLVLCSASLGAALLFDTACIRDTDCGICDPDHLLLESISGVNYASKKVHFLNPTCEGDACPDPIKKGHYFVEEIKRCEEDEDTLDFVQNLIDTGVVKATNEKAIERYVAEYCKITPLVVAFGIEFVFNNLLEPTTVELVRKRPDQPKLFEIYDWKSDIVAIAGPTSRYNGDFTKGESEEPDLVTRLVNLTCIDNLRDQDRTFSHEDYEDPTTNPCNQTFDHDGKGSTPPVPMKMRIGTGDAKLQSYRGILTAGSNSCDTPQDGADTCCTECDLLLGTRVAKYGLAGDGKTPLAPGDMSAPAIQCDAMMGDPFVDCRDFVVGIDRSDNPEAHYTYYWDCPPSDPGCEPIEAALPQYDRIRETHPDLRPAWIENRTSPCKASSECDQVGNEDQTIHNLPGTQCIGTDVDTGKACSVDADMSGTQCTMGVCRPQWFVGCFADPNTTGGDQGYCMDLRFNNAGAAACYTTTAKFKGACDDMGKSCSNYGSGKRFAKCNGENTDTLYTAAECCQESLGAVDLDPATDGIQCDPYTQPELAPIARYDRNDTLPDQTRVCVCKHLEEMSEDEATICAQAVQSGCYHADGSFIKDREGQYAVKFVQRFGGVVYDPAIKGFEWRIADYGGIQRAPIESCAEQTGDIRPRNRHEGWRANDAFDSENHEDYDRAMCSGQEYTVEFGVPGTEAKEYVKDKVGNTLEGHSEYTFTTPQFHVIPGSGFPSDNLRIGACDDFSIRFSNKYDMSPENQRKVALYRLIPGDPLDPTDDEITTPRDSCDQIVPVAGGSNCGETFEDLDGDGDGLADPCAIPCLTVNIAEQLTGQLIVEIDSTKFGAWLKPDERYRMVVPGLGSIDDISDQNAYLSAFWDACGMPLVAKDAEPYSYDFSIDTPKCKEDQDRDKIQLSCDNAPDNFNPDQGDLDHDGIGDVIDLCPTIAGSLSNNKADSDKDGVGNDCDVCRQTTKQYNTHDAGVTVPDYMFVRNIPWEVDTDEDGIGDVCDNCVVHANCEDWGLESFGAATDKPYTVGKAILFDDKNKCQRDDNQDLVGDICATDDMLPGAAGPIGVAADDDFDQDGLTNTQDACPRQPVPDQITCTGDGDCAGLGTCDGTVCDHVDADGDGVGDICDSCPFSPNPMQTMDGAMQAEDEDGDFVGTVCETSAQCANKQDPRPFSFYAVSANGLCCTTALVDDGAGNLSNSITKEPLIDPDGLPITTTCVEADDPEDNVCRKLPNSVAGAPGVLMLPAGCDEALMDAGITVEQNVKLDPADVESIDAYWNSICFLPQVDQDYDSLGDPCDLCPFDFDPDNQTYTDANGRVWPNNGKYCFGDYSIENKCMMEETNGTSGSESGTAGTSESGSATETGAGTTTGM